MTWLKRIGLFLLTNILVIVTISIITRLLGLEHYISEFGINYSALLIFCFIWGMAGALISLALSKVMAKWMMGIQEIDPQRPGQYAHLVDSVRRMSKLAGIAMPEVGVYESPELNAFATGPTRSSALVAVSSALLERMSEEEVEGVLGHEIAHIANGDMITMTLIQGVVNSFVMFFSRTISYAVGKMVNENLEGLVRWITTIILDIAFSILGSIVVAYFSRAREYRADYGGAKYAGREKMIAALEKLRTTFEPLDDRGASLSSLKISSSKFSIFSTHPDLGDRIATLKTIKIS